MHENPSPAAYPLSSPRTYPGRLQHRTPGWVKEGALFHVRIRVRAGAPLPLTHPALGPAVLDAFRNYHARERWWCGLAVLMPDHLHAMLAFPREPGMSETVRSWKRALTRLHAVRWQTGFFDHRLRDGRERDETWAYLRRNPVAQGLSRDEDSWPWQWSPADDGPGA